MKISHISQVSIVLSTITKAIMDPPYEETRIIASQLELDYGQSSYSFLYNHICQDSYIRGKECCV